MNIEHHLQPETLMAYAAGTLPAAMAFVVNCHTESCLQCRRELHSAESLGGQMLETLEAKPLSGAARAAVLAQLDKAPAQPLSKTVRAGESERQVSRGSHLPSGGLLPNAMKQLLQIDNYEQIKWRKLAPGVEKFNLPLKEGKSFLLRIGAGLAMPVHTHRGSELTLLLQGGYHDELGDFNVGDIADLDGSVEHQPVAFEDQPCICLAGMDDGLRFRGLIPSLMRPFIGL